MHSPGVGHASLAEPEAAVAPPVGVVGETWLTRPQPHQNNWSEGAAAA
ncbi:hypothetical protein [Streptomyces albus]